MDKIDLSRLINQLISMAPTLRKSSVKFDVTDMEEESSKLCGVCEVCVPDDCAIFCDGICNKWYDINCVKLSSDDYISINDLAENVKWFCGDCDIKLKGFLANEGLNSRTNSELAQLRNAVDILLDTVKGVVSENKILNEKMDKIIKGRMIESPTVETVVTEQIAAPWSQIRKSFGRGRGIANRQVPSSMDSGVKGQSIGSNIDSTNSNYRFQDAEVTDRSRSSDHDQAQGWKTVNYGRPNKFIKDFNKPSDLKTKFISKSDSSNRALETSVRPNMARSYKEAVIGKRTDSVIKCATKTFIKKKAVFVTRLDPCVKVSDIKDLIDTELNLQFAKCSQLKTKHDGYSSFHVEVHEKDLDLLLSAELWPAGCLVTQFRGFLKKESVLSTSDAEGDSFFPNPDPLLIK